MSEVKTFRGYRPKPWQRVVHDAITAAGPKAGKVFVVKSPRQIGKSLIVEQELLRHAIQYAGSVSICVSITFSNCKKLFKEIHNGIIQSGIVKSCDNQAMEMTFVNGSQIIFKSAQQRESLRSYTIKNNGILCVDEAAYIQDDIYSIIFPWTNVNHSNILMVSTPRIKQGMFYELFNEGLGGSETVVSFDLSKYDTSEMLSADKIELYRRKMPKAQFLTEILGEFSDTGAGVFDISKPIWSQDLRSEYSDVFIGIDWGTGTNGDYTVVSGFDPAGNQVMLELTNSMNPMEQIDWIVGIVTRIDRRKVRKILCERNSIGAVYFDSLRSRLEGYCVEDFTTTNQSKREIIEYLIQRVETSSLKLVCQKEQYLQMSSYAMEITPSGAITYNAITGVHDDCVIAAALAMKCVKDLESSTYAISFGKHRSKYDSRRK